MASQESLDTAGPVSTPALFLQMECVDIATLVVLMLCLHDINSAVIWKPQVTWQDFPGHLQV